MRRHRSEPIKVQEVWPTPTVNDLATWSTETLVNHKIMLTRRAQRLQVELEAVTGQLFMVDMLLDADHASKG